MLTLSCHHPQTFWAVSAITLQASPKENGTMFWCPKICPTPGRSSPNFENVQWDTYSYITEYHYAIQSVLFCLSSNKIDKNFCQCELLCAVPSCMLAPKCCLQPKKFSTPLILTTLSHDCDIVLLKEGYLRGYIYSLDCTTGLTFDPQNGTNQCSI